VVVSCVSVCGFCVLSVLWSVNSLILCVYLVCVCVCVYFEACGVCEFCGGWCVCGVCEFCGCWCVCLSVCG